jgi:excisionase family DNA binding protein
LSEREGDHVESYQTSEETARAMRVCVDTVRRLVKAGELRAFRVGGKNLRIPVSAIEEYFARHAAGPRDEATR